ncbi:hypothetical protein M3661_29645 [Paenibacillus sp. MER 180]|uniref:hypothetical protein n=1 Tax=Paenibacillus sp. MER 180 TaxID=2939570 RepID=UPI00203AB796|nr:hypothetical protein [Paenibacillus sp. MER 180]MCM3294254.1 hypothetical protein [Paenibacillus sp. MER 180]
MIELETIASKMYFRGCCIAAESTLLWVEELAGYTTITDIRMTGSMDTDVKLKAELALEQIVHHDIVVYVHVKAPDVMGPMMDH